MSAILPKGETLISSVTVHVKCNVKATRVVVVVDIQLAELQECFGGHFYVCA